MPNSKCKICDSTSKYIFSKSILQKYETDYYRCEFCGFIQINDPFWLNEAYAEAISSMDVGLINRNIHYSGKVESIIYDNFDKTGRFLDFAGGYGMFTRLMRDKGFDFYHQDKYSVNLFAKTFSIDDLSDLEKKFELVTAIELMEHLVNPYQELDFIFSMTNSFIFTTELVPEDDIENWWYFSPEHGQHVAFHTNKSLEFIAKKYNKFVFSSAQLHIITDKKELSNFESLPDDQLIHDLIQKILNKIDRPGNLTSRIQPDFEKMKKGVSPGK